MQLEIRLGDEDLQVLFRALRQRRSKQREYEEDQSCGPGAKDAPS
jgi:hypothetical protein